LSALLLPAGGDPAPEPALEEAERRLRAGEPVVLPTDTIYGGAADPRVAGATARLFALKHRPREVPLAVLVADVDQARQLIDRPSAGAGHLMERCWPGAVTLVLRRREGLRLDLGSSEHTIGLRCPAHPVPLALSRRIGPLATTSANLHGQSTPPTPDAIAEALEEVGLVLDAGPLPGTASTVVDCTGTDLRILREGAVDEATIRDAAG
jgi:L-threonylcarbamoyladenylate synthase